jgi:hypothetical protein
MFLVSPPVLGWGTVAYRPVTLDRQLDECPPQGPDPWRGCDQCLVRIYQPLNPLVRIFCGKIGAGMDWCIEPVRVCSQCNGSCAIMWSNAQLNYVNVLWGLGTVQTAIANCRQWETQVYCTKEGGGQIPGAYVLGDDFGWIENYQGNYADLRFDPRFQSEVARFAGGFPASDEESWRRRMGVFGVLAMQHPGYRTYYERAASLAAWFYIVGFAPNGQVDQMLLDNGFPLNIQGQNWNDLVDLFDATCSYAPFNDCTSALEASTWGDIKHRFRESERK